MTLREVVIEAIQKYHAKQDVKPTKIYISHNNVIELLGKRGQHGTACIIHGSYMLEVERTYTHNGHFFLSHDNDFESSIEYSVEL
jgi:hypothetical protein